MSQACDLCGKLQDWRICHECEERERREDSRAQNIATETRSTNDLLISVLKELKGIKSTLRKRTK